jgi:hypothetical protein
MRVAVCTVRYCIILPGIQYHNARRSAALNQIVSCIIADSSDSDSDSDSDKRQGQVTSDK